MPNSGRSAAVVVGARDRLDKSALPTELALLARLQYMALPDDLSVADVRAMISKLLRRFPDLKDDGTNT